MDIYHELTPAGVKTSAALGYFDGVHRGHAEILRETVRFAKTMRLKPAVFTFNFEKVRPGEKGGRDLFSKKEKYAIFESLGIELLIEADFAVVRDMTGQEFVRNVLGHGCLNAAVVNCGEDFRYGRGRDGDVDTLRRLAGPFGIQVNAVPFVTDGGVISTTRIKRLIAAGDIPAAAKLLGRPYGIEASAEEERGESSLTVRQRPDSALELPKFGVYLSFIETGGIRKFAVTYIGTRPTLTGGDTVYMDTRVLEDDAGAVTGRVELIRLLRPEEVFGGAGALREAIAADILRAKLRFSRPEQGE